MLHSRLYCWAATKTGMYKFVGEIPHEGKAVANGKLVTSVTVPGRARRPPQICPLSDLGDCPFPKGTRANTF